MKQVLILTGTGKRNRNSFVAAYQRRMMRDGNTLIPLICE
jgi:hypothetical protein